jgi:ATP-dependent exoDNAse (exonuclease V) beta subunit
VFVRSETELDRARAALERARIPYKILDDNVETTTGKASISTMHLAKGLEFRTVVVMACDDEVIPLQSRIEAVADDSDLEEAYNTERHLLYVACTRARDHLLVTGAQPASEFLDDLQSKANTTRRQLCTKALALFFQVQSSTGQVGRKGPAPCFQGQSSGQAAPHPTGWLCFFEPAQRGRAARLAPKLSRKTKSHRAISRSASPAHS